MISHSGPTPITHEFRDFGRIVKRHFCFNCTHLSVTQFLVCTHVIRRPCWCTKQKQNVARVLYNNRDKFPKDVFYTNMAAMTSEVFAALNLVRGGYVSIFFPQGSRFSYPAMPLVCVLDILSLLYCD